MASQPLDRICPYGRKICASQPGAPILGNHHIDESVEGDMHVEGREGGGNALHHKKTILAVTKQQRFKQACTCEFDC